MFVQSVNYQKISTNNKLMNRKFDSSIVSKPIKSDKKYINFGQAQFINNINADFLNDVDLKKFKKIQSNWAKDFAKQHGIPCENVKLRLSPLVLGDAKMMLKSSRLGYFTSKENKIYLTPIKEFLNANMTP